MNAGQFSFDRTSTQLFLFACMSLSGFFFVGVLSRTIGFYPDTLSGEFISMPRILCFEGLQQSPSRTL